MNTYALKLTDPNGTYTGHRHLNSLLATPQYAHAEAIRMSLLPHVGTVAVERCRHTHDAAHFVIDATYANGKAVSA